MNIDKELAEIRAIRAGLDDVIAHGKPADGDRLAVVFRDLQRLKDRIDVLYEDLNEAAIAHANDVSRRGSAFGFSVNGKSHKH